MKISVIEPFSQTKRTIVARTFSGDPLGGVIPHEHHTHIQGVVVNGAFVENWPEYRPTDFDQITIYTSPGYLGFLVPIIGVATNLAPAIVYAIVAGISVAVAAGLAYAVYALTPRPKLAFTPLGGASGSRREEAFGIAGLTNTVAPGTPKFVVYGERRVYGHVIGTRVNVENNGKGMSFSALYFMGDTGDDGYESISEIQINGTPVEDLPDITTETRLGTNPQTVIDGFEEVSQTYYDGRTLAYNTPVVYTLQDTSASRAQVIIDWPGGLKKLNQTTGEPLPGKSEIKLEYKRTVDPTWLLSSTNVVEKKADSRLFQEFNIVFGSSDAWEIRVTEIHDKTSTSPPTISQDASLFNIEEIQTTTRTYPGTALLSLKGVGQNVVQSLQQLEVSALVRGKKVKRWNGATFDGPLWTQQRMWIARDMLTHEKVGLGHRIPESFHDDDAAKSIQDSWLDTSVAGLDGEPNEARDKCDFIMNEKRPAWDWLKDVLSEARCAYIISGGKYKPIVDSTKTPELLYCMPGNIIEGTLTREIGHENRSINTVRGEFPDSDKNFKTNMLEVQDSAIGSDPIKDLNFTFLTLTREGNVYRELQYQLKRRILVRRRFKWTSPQGAEVSEPLDVTRLGYDTFNFNRGYSGFLLKQSASTVHYLDRPVILESGKTYKLTLRAMRDDGQVNRVDTLTITTGAGTHGIVETDVPSGFSDPPGTLWHIGEENVARLDVLIESTKGIENGVEITASEYFSSVYNLDPLPSRSARRFFRIPQTLPLPLWDAAVNEVTILNHDGSTASKIAFSVTPGLTRSSGQVFSASNGAPGALGLIFYNANTLPHPQTGLTSSDDGFFKNARLYMRSGGAAGFEAQITSHDPTASVGERIYLDTAFSPIPAQNDIFEIVHENYEATGGFVIELGESATGPWTEIADVTGFEHEMDASGGARTLYYRFTPVSIRGVRNPKARWIKSLAFTGDTSAPAAPTSVNITADFSRAKLTWTNPSAIDFAFIRIYRSTTNDDTTASLVDEISGNTYTDDQLAPDTYYYWLSSVDLSGNESAKHRTQLDGQSVVVSNALDSTPPATPTGLATGTSGRVANDGQFIAQITATWDANAESDLAGYELAYKRDAEPWGNHGSQFVDSNFGLIDFLDGNAAYDVRVRAIDTSGNKSAYTADVEQTTSDTPGAPSQVTGVFTQNFPLSILLAWDTNPETDIAYYEVEWDDNAGMTTPSVLDRTRSRFISNDVGVGGVTRYYRVRAVRRTGTPGNWSTIVSGTTTWVEAGQLGTDAVLSTNISDDSIETPHLKANIVTAAKIAANTIASGQLRTDIAVITTSAQIQSALIDTVHINTAAIQAAQIDSLAVTTAKIQDLNVSSIKIANNAVTNKGSSSGGAGTPGAGSYNTIRTVNITLQSGNAVFVIGRIIYYNDSQERFNVSTRIRRDDSAVLDEVTQNCSGDGTADSDTDGVGVVFAIDSTNSGSTSYDLDAQRNSQGGGSTLISSSHLVVTEYIK